jgi:hypothetical protein
MAGFEKLVAYMDRFEIRFANFLKSELPYSPSGNPDAKLVRVPDPISKEDARAISGMVLITIAIAVGVVLSLVFNAPKQGNRLPERKAPEPSGMMIEKKAGVSLHAKDVFYQTAFGREKKSPVVPSGQIIRVKARA